MTDFYEQTETIGGGSFMIGLLAGAVIGAGLGLLLAPRSGTELRRKLSARAGDLADQARDVAGRAADQAERYARDIAGSMPQMQEPPEV